MLSIERLCGMMGVRGAGGGVKYLARLLCSASDAGRKMVGGTERGRSSPPTLGYALHRPWLRVDKVKRKIESLRYLPGWLLPAVFVWGLLAIWRG